MFNKRPINKKTLSWINRIMFVLSLYPLGVMMWYIIMLILSALNLIENSVKILSDLISYKQYEEPFIVAAIAINFVVLFVSIFLAFYHLLGNNPKRRYWFLFISFLGGQIIIFLIDFFSSKRKIKRPIFKTKTLKKVRTLSLGTLLTSFVIIPVSIVPLSFKRSIDDPTSSFTNVTFSLDPNKPNVIEMFSDGLDPVMLTDTITPSDKKALSDFVVYRKFVTSSFITWTSFSRASSSYSVNDFWKGYEDKWSTLANGTKKYMINPMNTSNGDKYLYTWSGNGKTFEENNTDFNVLNWSQARNMAISDGRRLSPQFAPYYVYSKNIISGDPSYSVIQDHMLHGPIITHKNGGPSSIYSNKKTAYRKLLDSYESIVDKLKSLVDPKTNISAYQNTMIVVWGDHSSHGNTYPSYTHKGISRKNNSTLMIKPINTNIKTNAELTFNDDREIYAPFLSHIIKEGIKSKSTITKFINTNKNFDPGRQFATSLGNEKGVWITKFKGFMLHPITSIGINGWLNGYPTSNDVMTYLDKNILWKDN